LVSIGSMLQFRT